jgi:Arc/MetJ-type ribon-helix-helix transcriptional regulator
VKLTAEERAELERLVDRLGAVSAGDAVRRAVRLVLELTEAHELYIRRTEADKPERLILSG